MLDTKLDYQFSVEFCISNEPYKGELSCSPRSGIILTIKHLTQDQLRILENGLRNSDSLFFSNSDTKKITLIGCNIVSPGGIATDGFFRTVQAEHMLFGESFLERQEFISCNFALEGAEGFLFRLFHQTEKEGNNELLNHLSFPFLKNSHLSINQTTETEGNTSKTKYTFEIVSENYFTATEMIEQIGRVRSLFSLLTLKSLNANKVSLKIEEAVYDFLSSWNCVILDNSKTELLNICRIKVFSQKDRDDFSKIIAGWCKFFEINFNIISTTIDVHLYNYKKLKQLNQYSHYVMLCTSIERFYNEFPSQIVSAKHSASLRNLLLKFFKKKAPNKKSNDFFQEYQMRAINKKLATILSKQTSGVGKEVNALRNAIVHGDSKNRRLVQLENEDRIIKSLDWIFFALCFAVYKKIGFNKNMLKNYESALIESFLN